MVVVRLLATLVRYRNHRVPADGAGLGLRVISSVLDDAASRWLSRCPLGRFLGKTLRMDQP
jgi:hypothetical protein